MTVRIRLLAPRFVKPGSQIGDEFDVDARLAAKLVRQGRAEYVSAAPHPAVGGGGDGGLEDLARALEGQAAGEPDESWKVADLREYARAHGIDLGKVTKKADVLAAIRGAANHGDTAGDADATAPAGEAVEAPDDAPVDGE